MRVACRYCKRRGRYQLHSLVKKHGADTDLADVLKALSDDCALHGNRSNRRGCSGPYFPDLMTKRDRDLLRDKPDE